MVGPQLLRGPFQDAVPGHAEDPQLPLRGTAHDLDLHIALEAEAVVAEDGSRSTYETTSELMV